MSKLTVEAMIAAPSIEKLIEAAKTGDKSAAKSLAGLASVYLKTSMYGPLPVALALYLSNALVRVALGESADQTLNLKRSGRPRRDYRNCLIIAQRIYEDIQKGKTLEEASFECEEFFRVNIAAHGKLYGYTNPPDSKTLEGVYNEMLPEIKAIYSASQT
jgi:hypothetical protein